MDDLALVLSAAFFNFMFGLIWHVFIRKQKEISPDEISSELNKKDPSRHILSFIGSLWVSYGMFVLIKHIHPKGTLELLTIVIGIWLLIYIGLSMKHYSLKSKNLIKLVIDYTQDLIGLLIIGFILN